MDDLTSEALASRVIAYRVFSIYKEIAIASLQELRRRQDNGDPFDYEKFIEDEIENLPKPNMNIDLMKVINSLGGVK